MSEMPSPFRLLKNSELRAIVAGGQAADDKVGSPRLQERKNLITRFINTAEEESFLEENETGLKITPAEWKAFVRKIQNINPQPRDENKITNLTQTLYYYGRRNKTRANEPKTSFDLPPELSVTELYVISIMIKTIETAWHDPHFIERITHKKDLCLWIKLINCLSKIKNDGRYHNKIAGFESDQLENRLGESYAFLDNLLQQATTPKPLTRQAPAMARITPRTAQQAREILRSSYEEWINNLKGMVVLREQLKKLLICFQDRDLFYPPQVLEEILNVLYFKEERAKIIKTIKSQGCDFLTAIFYDDQKRLRENRDILRYGLSYLREQAHISNDPNLQENIITLENLLNSPLQPRIVGPGDLYFVKHYLIAIQSLKDFGFLEHLLPYCNPTSTKLDADGNAQPFTTYKLNSGNFHIEDNDSKGLKVHYQPAYLMIALADVMHCQHALIK